MGILLMVMVSTQTMQQRENQALTEKLSAVDVMRVMTSTLSNPTACGAILAASNLVDPSKLPFNATAANISSTNPYVITLKQIPNANISPGGAPSPLSNTLKLAPSSASPGGLQIVFTDPTTASLQVNFDQAKLIRPIKNLSFPLLTSATAGLTTIAGCQAGGAGGGACPNGQFMTGINSDGTPQCTTAGSQAGSPCTVPFYGTGVTSTGPYGRCCLVGSSGGSVDNGPDDAYCLGF